MEALAHQEHEACFWHRGLIPRKWTLVEPPVVSERWFTTGFNGPLTAGCLGSGAPQDPVVICGDASGGPDARDPRFRRVGLAIVV
eukprot:5180284-Pyramimonas_sp.AAC.1